MKTAYGVKKQGRPELDEIDIKELSDLVRMNIREGKTGKEISRDLGVSVYALDGMLGGAGISLKEIHNELEQESLARISERIDRYFNEHPTSIPEGAEEKWVERGSAKSLERYRKAFFMMLDGESTREISSELRISRNTFKSKIRPIIFPEFKQQQMAEAEAIFGFLESPGLTKCEIKVFRLRAVEWLSAKDTGDRLDIGESRVCQIESSIEKKIPALKRFFSAKRHSSETIEKMGARQEKRRLAMGQLDKYLETHGPKKLMRTVRKISASYVNPLGSAQTIVNALDTAGKEMERTNFPKRYRKAAIIVVIDQFHHDPIQTVTTLREIAGLADEEMNRLNVPHRYRPTVYGRVVYHGVNLNEPIDPTTIRERITEIKTTRDLIMEELESLDAPLECRGRIAGLLMYLKQPIKKIKERARGMAGTYNDLKSNIMKKGHPEIVAEYIGVPSLGRRNPLDDWKKELDSALKREYRYVKRREYVEKIGLTDTEFLALVDKSKRDDDTAKMELVKRFMPIIGHFKKGEKVQENKLLFLQILNDLPKENYSGHPLQDFTTYVAYAVRINSIRLSRIEQSWMHVHDGDEGYGGIDDIV